MKMPNEGQSFFENLIFLINRIFMSGKSTQIWFEMYTITTEQNQ